MEYAKERYQPDIVRSIYGEAVSSLIPVLALSYVLLSVIFYDSPYLKEEMHKWWAISFTAFSTNLIVVVSFITRPKNQTTNYLRWALRYDAICFLTGFSHGYFFLLLEIVNETVAMSYISFIFVAAVGSSINAGLRPASNFWYLLPILVMAGINFWQSDFFIAYVITSVVCIFITTAFSYKGISILKKSIDLRFENEELIEELKEQKELEKEANLDKSRFISAASHDLRQPLQSTNFMFAALKSKLTTPEQQTLFNKTQSSLDSLNAMIDSLLDISRFDSGNLEIACKDFYVNDVLANEVIQHLPNATQKDITINYECDEKLNIYFDPILFRRIISNLLDNSIKYTHSGDVSLTVQSDHLSIYLEVSDSGIGIPIKHQSEIFKEFYQINNPERDRRKGVGLGLSILKRLIDRLGGEITVNSSEGQGTTFKVTLPITQQKINSTETKDSPVEHQNEIVNSRVVIVDDDVDVLEALELLLEDWGVRTISASNTEEAIDRIKKLSDPEIHAVLADYRLRDNKTGLETIASIRQHLGKPTLPALMITGDTSPAEIDKIKQSGIRVLGKPINGDVLKSELHRMISAKL